MRISKVGLERPILNTSVNFPITLAPMVGLSHSSFRRVLRSYLPEGAETIWPTEMLNSRKIPKENLDRTPETKKNADDTGFIVPQILGNEEEPIRQSVICLKEWGASGIDINMGCPVTKALKHNYGVSLMGDSSYAGDVVRATVAASDLPVSVKLRAVESGNKEELLQFMEILLKNGASWLTLHPRRGSQKRRGEADWSQISWVRQRIDKPLIGNGDIQTVEDVLAMIDETHCDMVMVGRALTARPWLFWQLGESLGWPPPKGREGQRAPHGGEEEASEYGRSLRNLLRGLRNDLSSDSLIHRKFLFFVKTGSVWLDFGQELVGLVHRSSDLNQLDERLETFFSRELRMAATTQLRQ